MPDKYIEEARELLEPFCHFADGIEWCTNPSPDELREAIASALRSRDEQHRREVEEAIEARNAWWALMIKSHKCSLKGQSSLKDIVREGTGKHLLKWKLLYETLAAAVREEIPFPGETNDGRCPKCDDQVPCAYCIANVEPMEAQEQILSHSSKS